MDAYSFIVYVKIEKNYVKITKDVQSIFHTSNNVLERPLPEGKKQKNYQIDKRCIRLKNSAPFTPKT